MDESMNQEGFFAFQSEDDVKEHCERNNSMEFYANDVFPDGYEGCQVRLSWKCKIAHRKIKEHCEQNDSMEFYANDVFPDGYEGSMPRLVGILRTLKFNGKLASERVRGRKGLQWELLNE